MDRVLPEPAASGTNRRGCSCPTDRSPDPTGPAQALQHTDLGADRSATPHRGLRGSRSSSGWEAALDVQCVTTLLGGWREWE